MSDSYLGENLIFIISQPRSGSTLLQRVLAGHPDLATSSEPWLLLHPVSALRDSGRQVAFADYSMDWARQGVTEFLEHYTDGPEVYDDGIRAFAQTVYDNALSKGGGKRFIDKTPRYVVILDDLLRLFPQAKFVFLLRNPLSVLASILNTQISHDLYTLERFRGELLDGPGNMLRAIEQLGDAAIVVRYEEFVSAPEAQTKAICDELGIEYQPGMVDYSDSEPVKGFMQDRTGVHKHDRPSDTRLESWRQLLTSYQQVHFAQKYLQDLGEETLTRLGYSFDELNEAVREAASRVDTREHILPWRVALLHPQELQGLDQQTVGVYRSIRDHGPVAGRLLGARDFVVGFWRQMRFVFGRARNGR